MRLRFAPKTANARLMSALSWIVRAPAAPYFTTEHGATWMPLGQNDGVDWPELDGLHARQDLASVKRYLRMLADHGVTVLRLMLEYAETGHRYFEQPTGCWNPVMVQLWDDLFALCEAEGLRILLTPIDNFWTWIRWDLHPWNTANGGPCPSRTQLLTHPGARAAMKRRLAFATERWGASGVIFAWDLYNEMHPGQGEERAPECFTDYIDDVGPWLRALETRLHGRAHLQTVSVFGPELVWKPWIIPPIFRSRALDFANSHFYGEGTIDFPTDTVTPALEVGRQVRASLAQIDDGRPFFDTEHGPIHTFKDHYTTLPAAFDDEYFRHIQWAHLASGGAGGGMRWPNRDPHALTPGMRRAQRAMAGFLPLIDWPRFQRTPVQLSVHTPGVEAIGCGDTRQAVLWMVRRALLPNGQVSREPAPARLSVPGLTDGRYRLTVWDTREGATLEQRTVMSSNGKCDIDVASLAGDAALALSPSP